MSSRLLTMEEVAERTRLPLATLRYYRTLNPRKGPASAKLGRSVVYRESDVEAWIAEQFEADQARSA